MTTIGQWQSREDDDDGEDEIVKDPICCGPLLFKWSNAIDGYWTNLGSEDIQLQILSEDRGVHWYLHVLNKHPIASHDPVDVANTLYDLIRFAREATKEGFDDQSF